MAKHPCVIVHSSTVVQEPLPDLQRGDHHTDSSAIHPVKFVGTLQPWTTFAADALAAFQNHDWRRYKAQLELRPTTNPSVPSLLREHVLVGQEGGVQGRWMEHVGQDMTAILKDQLIPLRFGDFKASATAYAKQPDVACMGSNGTAELIGELKVPWVDSHSLTDAVTTDDKLRQVLGQIAEYMLDLGLAYAFMSTYEDTIFLRQVQAAGTWSLQYSEPIPHTNRGPQAVSVRMGMWFLVDEVQQGRSRANNLLRKTQWVKETRKGTF
ncbi:hypothetical protein CNMCM8927_008968 [Aspergillus lentulus]|uniref:Uncharacterized protein n=1 Tax=Aspergillus lentulus TaxID=293939 RepID=A0AAN5YLG5_ASPLE|nr:hypothetical protein CNMCM6069_008823 [Aspergillus lentulus]KAF4177916.1 hypothetical protein CNMCM8060_005016 [Aspergillus lentulus]KAF4187353.1 hypothetical protein CNMCM7927_004297 [Aspergillus lentulus]KAF4198926.1 hypothetical protein CNMCM8694_007532 [Aspergillus lentulus]KAF4203290.1 hypothetical protein CNMCM8927_008968 [Aspergillus lentulus]